MSKREIGWQIPIVPVHGTRYISGFGTKRMKGKSNLRRFPVHPLSSRICTVCDGEGRILRRKCIVCLGKGYHSAY